MEAHLYDELSEQESKHWWFRGRRAVIQSVLERELPTGPLRILDLGAGTGGMLPLLGKFGDVEGVEASAEAVAHAKRSQGERFALRQGTLPEAIPQHGALDVVTAFDVLEHLEDPRETLKAAHAALRPGGRFVCTVPAFEFLWSEHDTAHHHFRRYTEKALLDSLREAGFTPRYSSYFNSVLFLPIAFVRVWQRAVKGPRPGGRAANGSDLSLTPPLLNGLLTRLFSAEARAVPSRKLPFGVSLIAVVTRE